MKNSALEEKTTSMQYPSFLESGKLIEHISDAVIATDMNFKVTTYNRAAEDIYGISANDILGQSGFSMFLFCPTY